MWQGRGWAAMLKSSDSGSTDRGATLWALECGQSCCCWGSSRQQCRHRTSLQQCTLSECVKIRCQGQHDKRPAASPHCKPTCHKQPPAAPNTQSSPAQREAVQPGSFQGSCTRPYGSCGLSAAVRHLLVQGRFWRCMQSSPAHPAQQHVNNQYF